MDRNEAAEILGVTDPRKANEAYRELAKQCHPDGPTPDEAMFLRITQAKLVMLTPLKCSECGGQGKVSIGRVKVWCSSCGGRGVV